MTILLPTNITLLLQKGIAAARSGQSSEARQILEQVVEAEPENEMAWLWLSGLVTTNDQKRACLEKVLQANPENVYARAGLTRLQDASQVEADLLEARLAAVTSDNASAPSVPASARGSAPNARPVLKQLKPPHPSNGRGVQPPSASLQAAQPVEAARPSTTALPKSAPTSVPNPAEPICPSCDKPVPPTAKMCPYCFMPFKSVEELLGTHRRASASASTSSSRRRRRGILAYLGFTIGP